MLTFIITTHERPQLLQRALNSLGAQTVKDFSIIVVDDSSTYIPPYESLNQFAGRYTYVLRSGVSGPGASRDMGVQLAQTPYVMFLDDDDSVAPTHIESLQKQLSNRPQGIYFHDFKVLYEERQHDEPHVIRTESVSINNFSTSDVYVRNRVPNSCAVYPTEFLKHLRHDTSMIIYEDWDYMLQAIHGREITYIPIDTVNIHKSIPNAPENMRRGNSREDAVVSTTLMLYQRYPAPTTEIRLARQRFFEQAGITLPLDQF